MKAVPRRGFVIPAAFAVVLALLTPSARSAGPTQVHVPAPRAVTSGTWKPPAATWDVYSMTNLPIRMSDGVILRANVGIPLKKGTSTPSASLRFPSLVVQTPYRKDGGLFTVDNYFIQRGYAYVVVDVRGTGSSHGQWTSFGAREQADGPEIVRWAAHQKWANGKVGLIGASYAAINQLFTMEQPNAPKEVKAIFPVVPMSDAYRDVTFHGGNFDDAFIPGWLALVTALGAPPGSGITDGDSSALQVPVEHAQGAMGFQADAAKGVIAGGPLQYDGSYYRIRSPIERIARVRVPTFIVGGEFDLFQRGEPLLYNKLTNAPAKRLIMGPWIHIQGSTGSSSLDSAPLKLQQLQWFEHYLKDANTGIEREPRVLQYRLTGYQASGFVDTKTYPAPGLRPQNFYFNEGRSGSASSLNDGVLSTLPPKHAGSDPLPFNPTGTGCTRNTTQWGDASVWAPGTYMPCETDERPQELQELTYTTPVLKSPLTINGPINLHLIAESPQQRNATFSVHLTDVDEKGTSTQVTAGWLVASMRALDPDSPYAMAVGGKWLRVFHPFTQKSEKSVPFGPTVYDIEIFPTFATFKPGHRLRVAIGTGDAPHTVPGTSRLIDSMGAVFMVSRSPAFTSYLTLPVVRI
jgi:uncharacterized protein